MSGLLVAVIILLIIVVAVFAYWYFVLRCRSSADCPAGQTCVGGQCRAPTCAPPCPAGQVCVAGQCQPAPCSPPCPGGQVCVAGQCQTPCFSWASYDPSDGVFPSGVTGYDQGYLAPVVGYNGGKAYLGGTDPDPQNSDWGMVVGATASTPGQVNFNPNLIYYVAAAPGCSFTQTTDPTQALKFFDGTPVCWDFSETSGVFTPYTNGACDTADTPGGTFALVANSMYNPA
jgi:hypothetical protein